MNGPSKWENSTWVLEEAIMECGNAEADIWLINDKFWLGHDKPTYEVDKGWIQENIEGLWLHCKNVAAIEYFNEFHQLYHYFWHDVDRLTITSRGYLWAYPGNQPIRNSIAVMPEIHNDNISQCLGICTDHVLSYRGDV